MRLGVDASCWSNRRGFGRFTRELVAHMVAQRGEHEVTLIVDRQTADAAVLPDGARVAVAKTREQPTAAASAAGRRRLADVGRMSLAASRQPVDVFFFPTTYSYYPLLRRVPTLMTFHDATAENHPGMIFGNRRARWFWQLKSFMARRQATRILTISEDAKAQLAAVFGWPAARIHVINEGPSDDFMPLSDPPRIAAALHRYNLPANQPRVLYVGGISPHKNLVGLVRAMARVASMSDLPWRLVLAGDYAADAFLGCYAEVEAACRECGLRDRVTFTGYVPNDDLVTLYNAATLLVLPSFSEGFGLPVVEAMACGLPAAVSRRTSLPEVLGDAGEYFDPDNIDDMAVVIARVLRDPELRQRLRLAGLARVQQFTWRAAADKAWRILEEVAHGE